MNWIKHSTGARPVPAASMVAVRSACEEASTYGRAGAFDWSGDLDEEGAIHEYRVLQPGEVLPPDACVLQSSL